jgi:hypothetical protein
MSYVFGKPSTPPFYGDRKISITIERGNQILFGQRRVGDWNPFLIVIGNEGYLNVSKNFHASILMNAMDMSRWTLTWHPMQKWPRHVGFDNLESKPSNNPLK